MYLRLLHFITMDENIFTIIHNYEAVASGRITMTRFCHL